MRTARSTTAIFGLTIAGLGLSPLAHAEITLIDDFTSVSSPSATSTGWTTRVGSGFGQSGNQPDSALIEEVDLVDVYGGARRTQTTTNPYTFGSFTTNYGVSTNIDTRPGTGSRAGREGFFSLSTSFGGIGEFNLRYDAGGAGLNTDFSAATLIAVTLDPDHFGFGTPSVIDLTLTDGEQTATVTREWTSTYASFPSGFWDLEFSLSEFRVANPSLDLQNIHSLELNYLGDRAHDVTLDRIWVDAELTAIPSPATLTLLAGAGLIARRRRR